MQKIESLDTIESFNEEQWPWRGFAHVQDDVNPLIMYIVEGIFSLDAAHILCKQYTGLFIIFKQNKMSKSENKELINFCIIYCTVFITKKEQKYFDKLKGKEFVSLRGMGTISMEATVSIVFVSLLKRNLF